MTQRFQTKSLDLYELKQMTTKPNTGLFETNCSGLTFSAQHTPVGVLRFAALWVPRMAANARPVAFFEQDTLKGVLELGKIPAFKC